MTGMTRPGTGARGSVQATQAAPLVAAVDNSPASRRAVKEAVALAVELEAPLVFVYVRRGPAGFLGRPFYQQRLTSQMAPARRALDRALDIAATAGIEADAEILEGIPERRIVEFAHDRRAQMVIVGSRRRRLGRSVARAVARAADRPVMVAAPAGSV